MTSLQAVAGTAGICPVGSGEIQGSTGKNLCGSGAGSTAPAQIAAQVGREVLGEGQRLGNTAGACTNSDNTARIGGRAVGHNAECIVSVGSQTRDSVGVTGEACGQHAGVAHVEDGIGRTCVGVVRPRESCSGRSDIATGKARGNHASGGSGKGDGSNNGTVVSCAVGIHTEGIARLGSETRDGKAAGTDTGGNHGRVSHIDDRVSRSAAVVVAPRQCGTVRSHTRNREVVGLVASRQVAALQSHAHTIHVTGLAAAVSISGQGIVTSHWVGILTVAIPSNSLVVAARRGTELVRTAVVVVTVVVNDKHQVAGAVENIRSGQDNVVPAIAEIHAVAENLHSNGRIEQVDVAGAAE